MVKKIYLFAFVMLLAGCSGNQEATDTLFQEPDATKATAISYVNTGLIIQMEEVDFKDVPSKTIEGSYEFDKYGCVYIKDDTDNLKIQMLAAYLGQGSSDIHLSDDGKAVLTSNATVSFGEAREFTGRLVTTDEFQKTYDEKYKDYKNNLIIPDACKKGSFDKVLVDGNAIMVAGIHTLEGQYLQDLPDLGEPYVKS